MIFFVQHCFSQWHKREIDFGGRQPHGNLLTKDMHFSDSLNGFITLGDYFLQFDGNAWSKITPGLPFLASSVFTISPTNTFFGGVNGGIFKYDGTNIEIIRQMDNLNALEEPYNIQKIIMTDSTSGWAIGEKNKLFRIEPDTSYLVHFNDFANPKDICFDTPEHGWAISDRILIEYQNGKWKNHTYMIEDIFTALDISPSGILYVSGEKNLYKLNLLTNNLDAIFQQQLPFSLKDISMASDSFGIAISTDKSYLVLRNGSWETRQTKHINLQNVQCVSDETAWMTNSHISSRDTFLISRNTEILLKYDGKKWQNNHLSHLDYFETKPFTEPIETIYSIGRKTLFVNGFPIAMPENADWPDSIPYISNWAAATSDSKVFNAEYCWFANRVWGLSRQSGDTIFLGIPESIHSRGIKMHMFEDTSVFILQDGISVFKNRQLIKRYESPDYPVNIHFSGKNHGWVVGNSGLILRYSPENDEWIKETAPTQNRLQAIYAFDSVTIWAAGDNGTLLKCDGQTWEKVELNSSANFTEIYFTNVNDGWLVGDKGTIFRFNGQEWKLLPAFTDKNLYSVHMVDNNYGWVGAASGELWQYINTDTALSGRLSEDGIPSVVYPNPAVGGRVKIAFSLPASGETDIVIVDQNGKVVNLFHLGILESGKQTYEVPVQHLLKGIYYYQINSGSKSGTRM